MSRTQAGVIDRTLIDATAVAITRWGLNEVTLDRIAAEAGMSRATIYRRGVTREEPGRRPHLGGRRHLPARHLARPRPRWYCPRAAPRCTGSLVRHR
ncbi:helix-turn-helix domain-containing protein [Nocardioides convexus]|uniref:helix-turn-helix domain-containing protein n=1 Tax=Nocardioides convexus TaxID=2712224 RepID=UPI0024181FEC|nr:helix-turn-helix domain-containing protein [Nocardioides convexus]